MLRLAAKIYLSFVYKYDDWLYPLRLAAKISFSLFTSTLIGCQLPNKPSDWFIAEAKCEAIKRADSNILIIS